MAPKRKAAKGVEEVVAKVSRAAANKRKSEEEINVQPAKKSIDEQRLAAAKWAEEQFSPKKSPVKKEPVKKEPVKKAKAPAKVEEEEEDEEEEDVHPVPKTKSHRQAIAASAREHVRETHESSSPARKEVASPSRKEVSNKSTKVAASVNTVANKTQLTESVPAYKLVLQIVLFLFSLVALGLLFILYTNNSSTLELFNKFLPVRLTNLVRTREVMVNSHTISANIAYFSLFGFSALALILATI